eukprot:264028-Rhodomonas_salina.1
MQKLLQFAFSPSVENSFATTPVEAGGWDSKRPQSDACKCKRLGLKARGKTLHLALFGCA